MGNEIVFDQVSFRYDAAADTGVSEINLRIAPGETVLLCGESGSGKSTLIRMINGLVPHYFAGRLEGEVYIGGERLSQTSLEALARLVGCVFQDPHAQFFTTDVRSELAFTSENLGLDPGDIVAWIDQLAAEHHIAGLMNCSLHGLSQGQKQQVAATAAVSHYPQIVIMDEPSANLDYGAVQTLRDAIGKLRQAGKTVVIAEHRLAYLSGLVDRVVYLRGGHIERLMNFEELCALSPGEIQALGLRNPNLVTPEVIVANRQANPTADAAPFAPGGEYLSFSGFHYQYPRSSCPALDLEPFQVPEASITAVMGANGAGKSTFAACLLGQLPSRAKIRFHGQTWGRRQLQRACYLVMQNVNHQLFCETVADEVQLAAAPGVAWEPVLERLNLWELRDRHPLALSGGQRQRLAVATAAVSARQIIVFDEPTSGLDLRHMRETGRLLEDLREAGHTVFVITHDLELVTSTCDHLLWFEKGSLHTNAAISDRHLMKLLNTLEATHE